jgi:hypothetical protein
MNTKYIIACIVLLLSVKVKSQTIITNKYVQPSDLKEWISFLASDEMRGRKNGSPEMIKAAEWIALKFREYYILPLPGNSEYIQNYSFVSRQIHVNERNVLGIQPGSDPVLKDQYIVLSAHFDHVGIRRAVDGDSIYNGADDNAAGTSTIIGIAKSLKESGRKPGRSVIFAAFSGEEAGMRGSRYFVANPPVPLKNIFVDLNFEMTGHSEYLGKNKYYLTGCSTSNLDDVIKEFDRTSKFQLIDTVSMADYLFYGSDNAAFARISLNNNISTGIPCGTIATSTMPDYLHSPGDEISLFDFDNMAALVNHFSEFVLWLSEYKGEIKWTDPRFTRP